MESGVYQAAALVLRYVFAFAGVLIAALAVMTTVKDNRAQRELSRSGLTGKVARLLVYNPNGLEPICVKEVECAGSVGSVPFRDVVLSGRIVPRYAFDYEINEYGILVYPRGLVRIRYFLEHPFAGEGALRLKNGERFIVGRKQMKFVLYKVEEGAVSPANRRLNRSSLRFSTAGRKTKAKGGAK